MSRTIRKTRRAARPIGISIPYDLSPKSILRILLEQMRTDPEVARPPLPGSLAIVEIIPTYITALVVLGNPSEGTLTRRISLVHAVWIKEPLAAYSLTHAKIILSHFSELKELTGSLVILYEIPIDLAQRIVGEAARAGSSWYTHARLKNALMLRDLVTYAPEPPQSTGVYIEYKALDPSRYYISIDLKSK
jgi:hypothetical protein